MEVADRIVVMNRGRIEQIGRPVELYERPVNRFVAGFIGRMNVLRDLHGHALVGVRPEHIELVDGTELSHERRRGRVLRCVFLGSVTRVTISVDGAPITIELTGRRDDLAPDREVAIRIPAHAVLQLDDASS